MVEQEIFLLLGEVFHLIWIHLVMSKVSEDTHKLGMVIVDVIPFWYF